MSHIHCQTCSISQLCLPVMLAESEVEHLDRIINRGRPLSKGEFLYHAGDDFTALYAIRSGSLKSFTVTSEGEEQITGFHLPGEIVGLDAIVNSKHPSFTKALETSMICAIPFEQLEQLSAQIPGLQHQVYRVMSREIMEDQELLTLLGKKNADERMAAFLVNLSARFARRGLSSTQFRLTMTRADIGSYLGLAVETVSRLLTKLHKSEIIQVKDKEVTILQPQKLSTIAGTACVE